MKLRACLLALACSLPFAAPAIALDVETKATHAFMIDYDTGQVMLNKNGDQKMHPSSMSKLMTNYVAYKRLKEGRLKLDDQFTVSEKAWRMQGSKTFVHVADQVSVKDLLQGIIIQSGNDACIVLAEGISGSEEAFAGEMNKTAQELGLTNSHFVNATGWPDEGQLMSPRDLSTLARRLIADFPEDYHFYAEKSFTYNGITQPNRNRLLGNDIGVDGLKTGHTEIAGYGITLSNKDPKTGRRLILVINGLTSDHERMEEGDRLLRWGLREFTNVPLVKAGVPVAEAKLWFGAKPTVPLTSGKDETVTLPHAALENIAFTLRYNGPIPAPVAKGTHIADLVVTAKGEEPRTVPLIAAEDAPAVSGVNKIWRTIQYYVLHKA